MRNATPDFSKYSQAALFDEWHNSIHEFGNSVILDRMWLAQHLGIPIGDWGSVSIHHIPDDIPLSTENYRHIRVLEEVFTRICKFPENNMGSYFGLKNGDQRAYVQWSLWAAYNIGFSSAIKAVEEMERRKNAQ